MATSSITKNFVINTIEQAETFANAIEESYQESLSRSNNKSLFENLNGNAADMNKLEERWLTK